jgi:hypothetical protein
MGRSRVDGIVTMGDGDIRAWIEQEAIHIKAFDNHGDPVELSAEEARILAQELLRLAEGVEKDERVDLQA